MNVWENQSGASHRVHSRWSPSGREAGPGTGEEDRTTRWERLMTCPRSEADSAASRGGDARGCAAACVPPHSTARRTPTDPRGRRHAAWRGARQARVPAPRPAWTHVPAERETRYGRATAATAASFPPAGHTFQNRSVHDATSQPPHSIEVAHPPCGGWEVGRFETAQSRRAYSPCGCCISRPPDAGITSVCARKRTGTKNPPGCRRWGPLCEEFRRSLVPEFAARKSRCQEEEECATNASNPSAPRASSHRNV